MIFNMPNVPGIVALRKLGNLVDDNFSQPNLPVIQQSVLFARNKNIPSAARYHRSGVDSLSVGYMTDIRFSAALETICDQNRRGLTWRAIPGETSKQFDLLLAFVESNPDSSVIEIIMEGSHEEDYSEEQSESIGENVNSIAAFEKRTERLIELVKAKAENDITKTPVQLIILRKVDPANRKVTYSSTLTVDNLYQSALDWIAGERNLPSWIKLSISKKGESQPRHIAPLGIIAFSKQLYSNLGAKHQEIVGIPAEEALKLFLNSGRIQRPRVHRLLRLTLTRRKTAFSWSFSHSTYPSKLGETC